MEEKEKINFKEMTVEEALKYCYKHENIYISQLIADGEDGYRQFDCLVDCLKSGDIKPKELPSYGMEY